MTDISRLVLTRKVYQSIHIGDLITVTVEEIRGRTVRLSVEAPRGIAVHRREIYERISAGAVDRDDARGGAEGGRLVSGPEPGDMCGEPL